MMDKKSQTTNTCVPNATKGFCKYPNIKPYNWLLSIQYQEQFTCICTKQVESILYTGTTNKTVQYRQSIEIQDLMICDDGM